MMQPNVFQLALRFNGVREWLDFMEDKFNLMLENTRDFTVEDLKKLRKHQSDIEEKMNGKLEPLIERILLKLRDMEVCVNQKLCNQDVLIRKMNVADKILIRSIIDEYISEKKSQQQGEKQTGDDGEKQAIEVLQAEINLLREFDLNFHKEITEKLCDIQVSSERLDNVLKILQNLHEKIDSINTRMLRQFQDVVETIEQLKDWRKHPRHVDARTMIG